MNANPELIKNTQDTLTSLWLAAPLLVLLAAAVAVLIADVALPAARRRAVLPAVSLGGVALAFLALLATGSSGGPYFQGALQAGGLVFLAQAIILAASFFALLISPRWLEGRAVPLGEYYALLLFATLAMLALAASAELLALFLNLELLSITLYILTGIEKRNTAGTEAAFKYFLLGSFAAAFLLLGIAFVFGSTGQTQFGEIVKAIRTPLEFRQPFFLALGLGLIFVGFGFKLTLAPFHMYAPDVYEGAPTPVAALIATASKVAGFCVLFSLVSVARAGALAQPGFLKPVWLVLYAVAAVSMIVGNFGAVVQPSLKRLLAYSSIAHSAYMVIPLVVMLAQPAADNGAQGALGFYLMAYTLMTLLAFAVPATLGPWAEGDMDRWRGLGRRAPWLAAVMTLALISLTGVPPTIGFFGKFQLFQVAVRGGHVGLAILGVVSSVASAFYYLRLVVAMYMREPADDEATPLPAVGGANMVALGLGAFGIFALIFMAGM